MTLWNDNMQKMRVSMDDNFLKKWFQNADSMGSTLYIIMKIQVIQNTHQFHWVVIISNLITQDTIYQTCNCLYLTIFVFSFQA